MYISIDIGGTSTRVALFSDSSKIIELKKFSTNQNYESTRDEIFQAMSDLVGDNDLSGISVGLPGIIDQKNQEIVSLPHLPEWTGKTIHNDFKNHFNVEVILSNDTDLGALGESIDGAGAGYTIVGYVAIGTGFGGGRIVNEKIDENRQGFEPGHMIINEDDICSNSFLHNGSLESYVSGTALFEKYNIVSCSECNDPQIWDEVGRSLAVGLINLNLLWSPDVIVLGGGVVINAGERLLEPTKKHISEKLKVFKEPQIKIAKLGDQANLIGGYYNIIHYLKNL